MEREPSASCSARPLIACWRPPLVGSSREPGNKDLEKAVGRGQLPGAQAWVGKGSGGELGTQNTEPAVKIVCG